MACSSMTVSSYPATGQGAKHALKEHNGLRRSNSSLDLCYKAGFRRSQSDNQLHLLTNRVHATMIEPKLKSSKSFGIFPFQISSTIIPNSLRSFLFDPETSKGMEMVEKENTDIEQNVVESDGDDEVKRSNWVDRLLEIRSRWRSRQKTDDDTDEDDDDVCVVDENADRVCHSDDECDDHDQGGEIKYDRETFSKFLAPVSWSDTKLFSKLAFLCNMAYVIPEIKAIDLRKHYGLHFVTSSLELKAEAAAIKEKVDQDSVRLPVEASESNSDTSGEKGAARSSVAYEIAVSAASYVQSRAKGHLAREPGLKKEGDSMDLCKCGDLLVEADGSHRIYNSEVAACVAASTMTALVAAGEKEKQRAARDLQSLHSSPCEWFICDDRNTYTRCFVIQGSDSLASWQANLFFEPAKFEKTEVLVHRGIYEAAKGIYEQFMPEIIEHLNTHGKRAKLQFTGHSLGGSLSLLVHLMLLTRNVVKPSALRPVVTFGSPFVFCGGQKILKNLGLDEDQVHCVIAHRDIVPRAFSCNYPDSVAVLLRRLNGSFRTHPCLNKKKLLYSPLGKIFILQPDEKSSPSHPLLPPGSALYAVDTNQNGYSSSVLKAFLNCPHPLETLSDPTAYGSEGTILRDHDSSNYLKAVNRVLRQNMKMVVKKVRKQKNLLWPLLTSPSPHSWNHENNLDGSMMVNKEVMTRV